MPVQASRSKLLIRADSCKNLSDAFLDTTGAGIGECYTMRAHFMGKRRRPWIVGISAFVIAVCGLRLLLGYLFGGTEDQAGYLRLWRTIEQHGNLYVATRIQVWPPLWWILLGLWASLWRGLGTLAPGLTQFLGPSYAIKLLYYASEVSLAFVLGIHLARVRARGAPFSHGEIWHYAGFFLLLPATWVITSLHGNFDAIPAFLVIAAFLLLEYKNSETSALLAALCVGFAAMARTFPGVFAFPIVALILRRHGWKSSLFAAFLAFAPSFLSLYPIYLMTPDAVMQALGYRGIEGAWWGFAAIARIVISDAMGLTLFRVSYPVFYTALVLLVVGLCWGLLKGRIGSLQAGVLLTLGLFIFAPTISNQNFYFLLPWATWYAFAHGQRPAKVFLVAVSVNLFLVYVVLPLNLTNPIWFQWTYDQVGAGHVAPIPSPRFLVRFLDWFASVFKRRELGFAPFIHLMLRMPVWGVMIWWFVSSLRDVFPNRPIAAVRVATP
jgi:hypothetical protein